MANDKNHAVIIADDSFLSRRLQSALTGRWQKEKGKTTQSLQYNEDKVQLQKFHGLKTGTDHLMLLQPGHPIGMAYPHNNRTKSTDIKRLYALSTDAFRLVVYLLNSSSKRDISFDGITGRIRFSPPNQFIRESVAAQFVNGKVQLINLHVDSEIHEEH